MNEIEQGWEVIWSNTHTWRLITILGVSMVALILAGLLKRNLLVKISDNARMYKARKAVNMIVYLLIVLVVLMVYSDKLGNVGVALGVAGAGIAFALQEVIVSIAGWITILLAGTVSVGQRVKIGEVYGDIIDIGVFNTTIMETGDWVNGDLYNGRIVSLSNSFVYKDRVHNYSAEYPFLWDEMTIPIRMESDIELAQKLFEGVLEEVCGEYARQSKDEWRKLTMKYRVEDAQVSPMVTMTFDENWISFTLRYIVDFKRRRGTKDEISRRVLAAIKASAGKVQVGASTLEVTNVEGT